ncbi:UDP-4-amino-4,6-dideoxy-N-acetyl-beta-L-altrosamine transaminase [Anaeromusa sp.]|uniref:UDP-4-amino-4, 6-dideoxy-N-acetyl-beta-L-altrosamine transaminase n=1 Tax=Anaeromusa sp. TaxID=1872520 RepID=UPI002614BD94|nr:UDP-4-amino-4,6-dideoxy-N-acetyl-beta-L-altrosamine transaminase [Anaeromusa sp.]MDD3158153.1 UDP-4-amino-4,6-dideoxy-N-acetyl-beta-L-altrosamine transaminase [Anaeromusa sp.]
MIPYARQHLDEEDIKAVQEVLQSPFLTQGPQLELFEREVAAHGAAAHAVAVSHATAGLHIACLALGLGVGDYLWTTPNTFVASANCACYCGAKVDFVDIDPRTYNLCPEKLALKLAEAEVKGQLPKILVAVHFAGQSCDMERISELAKQYGFAVIEDASHALGGTYKGKSIGCCEHSDATIFSFHPVKSITSGEGGMVLTNREDLDKKLRLLRSHGITRNEGEMEGASEGSWYYQQIDLGFNYRMTDIQAALGRSQLKKLNRFVERRRELAARYNELLAGLSLILPQQISYGSSAWHLYVVRLPRGLRKQVFDAMRQAGIGVNVHYIPVHLQPFYRRMGFQEGAFPEAERYYQEALTLPLYYDLTYEEQDYVVNTLDPLLRRGDAKHRGG